jgi:TP901 family phage tail tape measure protein
MRAEFGSLLTGLRTATAETRTLATAAVEAQAKQQQGLAALGRGSLLAGAAIGAGIGLAISKFAEFDHEMSAVQAATHESARTMGVLRDAAIEAGNKTVFSATEAAQAETELAKAGVSARDILGGGLTGALSLASAGNLGVADAAGIAATAMTQFGLAGRQIPHIADLLAAGSNKALGEVQDLAEALQFVGPVAHGMGVSIEQTVGVLAEFAQAGQVGERGGTGLRGVLLSLTSPSQQAAKEMKALGISLYDQRGQFIGLSGTAQVLHDAFSKLSPQVRDSALGMIFGNQQVTAARVLYEGGAKAVDNWTRKVNDQGYAAQTAAIKMDNLKGDLNNLSSSFETALIKSGSGANTVLRGLTQSVTGVVNGFSALPDPVTAAVTGLSAVTAATLLASGALATFGPKLAAARLQLEGLGVAGRATSAGIGLAGSALAGFAAAIIPLEAFGAVLNHFAADAADVDKLTASLERFEKTGKASGEAARVFGRGLLDIDTDIRLLEDHSNTGANAVRELDKAWRTFLPFGTDSSVFKQAADNTTALDKSLAGLVASGHAKDAASLFLQIEVNASREGIALDRVKGLFPEYEDALGKVAVSTAKASAGSEGLNVGLHGTSKAMQDVLSPTKAQQAAIDDLATTIAGFVSPVGVYTQVLQDKQQKEQASAQATADATKSGKDSWKDYAHSVHESIDDYLTDLEKQIHAEDNWETNLLKLAGRGVRPAVLAVLEGMGKDAAPLIADLVDAPKKELDRAGRDLLKTTDKHSKEQAALLAAAAPVLAKVAAVSGEKVAAAYARKLAEGKTTVEEIMIGYGLAIGHAVPGDVHTDVHVDGIPAGIAAAAHLTDVLSHLDGKIWTAELRFKATYGGKQLPDGLPSPNLRPSPDAKFTAPPAARFPNPVGHAMGGFVEGPGTGTSDSVLARLSHGEYVVNAASTSRNLDLLRAINGDRGFADGGYVHAMRMPVMAGAASPGGGGDRTGMRVESGAIQIRADRYEDAYAIAGQAVRQLSDLVWQQGGWDPT